MHRWKDAERYVTSSSLKPWLLIVGLSYAVDVVLAYDALPNSTGNFQAIFRITYAVIGLAEYGSITLLRESLPYEYIITTGAALIYDIFQLVFSNLSHAYEASQEFMTWDLSMLVRTARSILLTLLVCQHLFMPNIKWDVITIWLKGVFRVKPVHFEGSRDEKQGQLKVDSLCDFIKELSIFLPHVTPRKKPKVQLALVALAVSALADRIVVVAIPSQLGIITDKITAEGITEKNTLYRPLVLWFMLGLLQGQCGLRTIRQASYDCARSFMNQQLSRTAFNHVMSLSMSFHDGKDSADVLGAVYECDALAELLDFIFLDILPSFVDMALGCAYLYSLFDSKVMIVLFCKASVYIVFDIWTSQMRSDNRRQRSKIRRKERSLISQAVSGWSTVAYFGQFGYENQRVADITSQHEEADVIAKRLYYLQYSILEALMTASHFSVIQLVLTKIVRGESSAGQLITLRSHWEYMMTPLRRVTTYYQLMQYYIVPVERLATLLRTKAAIVNAPDAYRLPPGPGEVRFRNVSFAYDDRKLTIANMDFIAPAGTTVGLVGETGAGKSTVFKLLSRFYDITPANDTDDMTSSRIAIDGHDVRSITQESLRSAIGIVPQNPALFNDSIRENVRYARLEATDEHVEEACRSAILHDRIMSFPDGYKSRAGERGVKLSGGELQRVAIARIFLQLQAKKLGNSDNDRATDTTEAAIEPAVGKPALRIILLDEATSSVDTETESRIHASLIEKLRATRCTVFIIAHRLSTVVGADEIFVLGEPKPTTQENANSAANPRTNGEPAEQQNGAAKPSTPGDRKQHSGLSGSKEDAASTNEEKNEPSGKTQEFGATILERGTHAELISKPEGKYKRLWEKQMASIPIGMLGKLQQEKEDQ
ncbi:MAG: hypothetical protein M1831_005655 [Alyxoria varia]|nr:MAG: hypothetical protein M1831_005655 [Alyxoria varia]